MAETLYALYQDDVYVAKMADLVAPRVERFVQRLMGIPRYEYSDGRYPGFSADITGCHYPLRDDHIEHINRVVVGHLMLRCSQLAYFSSRLDPTLSREERATYDRHLDHLGRLFRGETGPKEQPVLKQQLVFALAILHDVGKTGLLDDAGHEERGGALVEQVLKRLQVPLALDVDDIRLGRALIENHTMLGTLVQGERSAYEVYHWLHNNIKAPLLQKFLAYLLLLNSMDVAGFRYAPILMNPYWLGRYLDLSDISTIERCADAPIEFAERRLKEMARAEVGEAIMSPDKEEFHAQVHQELQGLKPDVKTRLGTMWIRDTLYFIIRVNEMGTRKGDWNEEGDWSNHYAKCYVRFFEALAMIALQTNAKMIAFRRGDNPLLREQMPAGVHELLKNLAAGHRVVSGAFQSEAPIDRVEFTINEKGMLCPLE